MQKSPSRAAGRRPAFTLIELLLAVAVMGILMALGLPRLGRAREYGAVRSAKQQVAAYLVTTRAAAIRRGQPATFHVAGDSIWITSVPPGGPATTVAAVIPLDVEHGVTLAASIDSVRFDSRGFPSNIAGVQVFSVTRGALADSVCLSRGGVVGRCGY